MTQKKILALLAEIPEAKKKLRHSADEAMRKRGGGERDNLTMVGGKSTLAKNQQEHSIGVIFSGIGTDGTLGLRAIKEMGGSVFVQSPETAKFDCIPHSAIDTGLANVFAPVQELPACTSTFIHHAPLFTKSGLTDQTIARSALAGECASGSK
jgi:hypothetical protein